MRSIRWPIASRRPLRLSVAALAIALLAGLLASLSVPAVPALAAIGTPIDLGANEVDDTGSAALAVTTLATAQVPASSS